MKTHHILAHAMKRCVRPRAAIIAFSHNCSGDILISLVEDCAIHRLNHLARGDYSVSINFQNSSITIRGTFLRKNEYNQRKCNS